MLVLYILCFIVSPVLGLSLDYCANENLGTSSDTFSTYMSDGLCSDTCSGGGYSVAIVQGNYCWCGNNLPGNTVSSSNCDTPCPGYPQENCAGNGYYGYMVVGLPSGTISSSSSSTSSSTSTKSSTSKSKSSLTLTKSSSTSSSSTSSSTSSSSTSSTSTSSSPSSTSSSSTTNLTPTSSTTSSLTDSSNGSSGNESSGTSKSTSSALIRTSVYYSSETNQGSSVIIKTQYITQYPSTTSSPSSSVTGSSSISSSEGSSTGILSSGVNDNVNKNSFFDSKGKVAGTFTAVGIVVVAIIAALLYCFCFARRKNTQEEYTDNEKHFSSSEFVPIGDDPDTPNSYNGSSDGSHKLRRDNSSKSMLSFLTTSAVSPLDRSASKKNKHSKSDSTGSAMMPISELDSRMDPNTMFLNFNESTKSLDDNQDYSRKILKVTNPE